MAKRIVFCADGTWNSPDQDEDDDRSSDPTNVYKLFAGLSGSPAADDADEQERMLFEGGRLVQVAKYLHGVGDLSNPVRKVVGGVFGAGILSRIVRGYTFVSRHYRPGDDIVLILDSSVANPFRR